MSQSVDRLKELLFDDEARTLSDLEKRVDGLAESEAKKRAEIVSRLDTVFERAGTEERFVTSVAGVIDSALRKAEVDRHSALADAVAPLVVRTIKVEIGNSRDELVEALYPMTGRMVKAYVASAMKDLANDINRRLGSNPVMLRFRSLTTGKSVAELAMAESQQLQVEELYLVRRGSGELVGRWPQASGEEGRDHVMTGILTAINEFSTAALKDEGSTLRQIDIGERQLYLRASPVYLLAAKCSGTAPREIEAILDETFLGALEGIHKDRDTYGSLEAAAAKRASLLSNISRDLDANVGAKQAELAQERAGLSPLKMMAWVLGLPLAAWIGWTIYAEYRTDLAQRVAAEVISSTAEISGYPTRLDVSRLGRTVTIGGLAPTPAVKESVIARLRSALPQSEIRDQLSVLPSGLDEIEPEIERVKRELSGLEPQIAKVRKNVLDIEPEIAKVRGEISSFEPKVAIVRDRVEGLVPEIAKVQSSVAEMEARLKHSAVQRALGRASRRLGETQGELQRLLSTVDSGEAKSLVRRISGLITQAIADLETQIAGLSKDETGAASSSALSGDINALTLKLNGAVAELSALMAAGNSPAPAKQSSRAIPAGITESAEELSAETERLAATTIAVAQASALKKSLPPPPIPVAAYAPSLREKLEAWTRSNAVFFSEGIGYRNEAKAALTLDGLAQLMSSGDHLIRVVGYTDDKGGSSRNSTLSQERAQKVVADLVARGVPARKLVAVGRLDALDLSPALGDASPNRRVEFEVGFDGEAPE